MMPWEMVESPPLEVSERCVDVALKDSSELGSIMLMVGHNDLKGLF